MTIPRPRPPLISLRCTYSGSPGMQWTATVRLRIVGDQYEVRQFGGDCRREDLLPAKLPAWRVLAEFLADQEDEWGIPEQALQEAAVTGETGWHADLLLLAWARFVDHDVKLGAIACAMPDEWLVALRHRHRSLVPSYGCPAPFIDDLHLLRHHLDESAPLASQLLDLVTKHGATSPDPLGCLLKRLREDDE